MHVPRALAVLVALIPVGFAPPASGSSAADEAAVRQATHHATEALNKGDLEAHLAAYAEVVVNIDGNLNPAAHRRGHEEQLAQQKRSTQKIADEGDVVFLSPDVAIHRFSRELTGLVDDGGRPLPPERAKLARIYAKRNGQWLVVANFSQPVEP
jgi:uncharacterized protein (TIGR02246 family)